MFKGYLQRKASWEILLKVSAGFHSDSALEKVLNSYDFNSLDKAFVTELAFGSIRYRKFLDLWINHTSKLNYKKQPPKLRWLLHIGLYQILKMDKIPFSASISTTVEVAKKTDLKGLSGVVNGILRNTITKINSGDLPLLPNDRAQKISTVESIPLWLVNEMISWLGFEKTEEITKSFNQRPTIDLRVDSNKTSIDRVIKEFKKKNIIACRISNLENGIQLKNNPRSIKSLPGYKKGEWVIQDRSSQWIAPLLVAKEGHKILDLCSAPGSKTTHLAEIINNNGEIWSVDKSKRRLKKLYENLRRLNIKCVEVLNADAINLFNLKPKFINYFDRILIDAPCSGIGTFRRNPDARWTLSKEKIHQLVMLQEKLLENSIVLLKEKGILVYSTCTICPFENNFLINKFIEKNRNVELISEKQILPNTNAPGDGFYGAVLKLNKKF